MTIFIRTTTILALVSILGLVEPVWSDEGEWEYQVVILKGITAGGTIERKSSRIYIDTNKTEALAELAADGWEVVSVVGAPGSDDSVYLRRPRKK
ncbi:MAG: DUF4177 domain-containing protein [Woeseiaceae bacterium]|nr:DUF4177 domain-containing protein [Woeseiaceae bacterium]